MPAADDSKRKAARETINTNLDRQSLSYCVSLIENGVNPEALAKLIKELRVQTARYEAERGGEAASVA
ncbi:hypothetical protein LTR12_001874 [Friedmanniomyces endolithicus]|nr:hypothetical protein LTR12_001874 [Friedmanniomyces endolithicus]